MLAKGACWYEQSLAGCVHWDVPSSTAGLPIVQDRVQVRERRKELVRAHELQTGLPYIFCGTTKHSTFRLGVLDHCDGLILKVEGYVTYQFVRLVYSFTY